jgi:N-acetylmuramoyl-L-alanine amidase
MISVFSRKREIRLRKNILKGVYEDNLRILGRAPRLIRKRTIFSFKKTVLFVSVMIIALLLNGKYLDFPLLQEKQMAASFSENAYHRTSEDYGAFLSMLEQKSTYADKGSGALSDYKAFLNIPQVSLSRLFGLKVKTIMIDPGHGGSFSGAIGKMGTKEKEITLDIARRLKNRLKRHGRFNVVMTRDRDVTVPLEKRIELAHSEKADIFISIHVNYLPSNPMNIIETYFFGPPSDAKTLKLAEHENEASQYALSEFKEIIEKIGNTLKYQESRQLAASIQKKLYLNIKKEDRSVRNYGVKRAPFLVLLGVDVPAVLTEVSCLSNSEEEMKLNTETHRENIAYYIEVGILDYINKGEAIYEAKRR